MGKYSLENYEKYKTYKIRPQIRQTSPENIGCKTINYITLLWEELETERGRYDMNPLQEALRKTRNPVLILNPRIPTWVNDHGSEYFSKLIRKVGSFLSGNRQLVGVVISTAEDSSREWEAYIQAFDDIPILADIHNNMLIHYLSVSQTGFGLIVKCSEETWLESAEAFARQNLQYTWERYPVLLQVTGDVCGPHIVSQAMRWHAVAADKQLEIGYNFIIRRLTYPQEVSSNGALPLRFWFENTGNAPCYREFTIMIRLQQGNLSYDIPLMADTKAWKLGDITYNEIVSLPAMKQGTYTISVGAFFEENNPMYLGIETPEINGFYSMGTIAVDMVEREELFHIWEDYYPEGYYPLEDPKAPEDVVI